MSPSSEEYETHTALSRWKSTPFPRNSFAFLIFFQKDQHLLAPGYLTVILISSSTETTIHGTGQPRCQMNDTSGFITDPLPARLQQRMSYNDWKSKWDWEIEWSRRNEGRSIESLSLLHQRSIQGSSEPTMPFRNTLRKVEKMCWAIKKELSSQRLSMTTIGNRLLKEENS